MLGFFATALLYAGAGFAGGSTYLALLVLMGWKTTGIAALALSCNILVAGQGAILFHVKDSLRWRNALPFLIASIPMALLGGLFHIRTETWMVVLGCSLLLSGFALLLPKRAEGRSLDLVSPRIIWPVGIAIGGGLGFLAGLVGIGGGIFLSPMLHFLGIGKGREIAAMATAFILLNSASGLAGQIVKSGPPAWNISSFALWTAVFLGGNLGSRWAVLRLTNRTLRFWTAALVLLAAARILLKTG